jgi:hypothetical protein
MDLPKAIIKRVYLPTETLGTWWFDGVAICKTMELPDRGNARSISCIPEGEYVVTKEKPIPKDDPRTPEDESGGRKPRDYWHFRFHDVPNRSGILVHKITYVKDLLGCVGVGLDFKDWNKDGVPDMADSTMALHKLVGIMPDKFILKIEKK